MNEYLLRRAVFTALLSLLALASAGRAQTFDQLTQSGFKEVLAASNARPVAAPSARAAGQAASDGAFLSSGRSGQIFFCSAAGCREILAAGGGIVVSSGKGALYFTGNAGTGWCSASACSVLIPGVQATFALEVGPNGDIWATSRAAAYHCRPTACRRAASEPLVTGSNFIAGVYKASGDFVASNDAGTFWCSGDACRRISDADALFVEKACSGLAPLDASYGFIGRAMWRCEPSGCREIGGTDGVDHFMTCAFDAAGRIHLPAADGRGSIACGTSCGRDPLFVSGTQSTASRGPGAGLTEGTDGAVYGFLEPRGGAAKAATTVVLRGSTKFQVPAACWSWFAGDPDDDELPAGWTNDCRLVP